MNKELFKLLDEEAPKCRADCINGPRPCPWIRCKWHAIWMQPKAAPSKHRLGRQSYQGKLFRQCNDRIADVVCSLKYSCVLDLCDGGSAPNRASSATLQEVGDLMNVSRERARQLLDAKGYFGCALRKLRNNKRLQYIADYEDYPIGERRDAV